MKQKKLQAEFNKSKDLLHVKVIHISVKKDIFIVKDQITIMLRVFTKTGSYCDDWYLDKWEDGVYRFGEYSMDGPYAEGKNPYELLVREIMKKMNLEYEYEILRQQL